MQLDRWSSLLQKLYALHLFIFKTKNILANYKYLRTDNIPVIFVMKNIEKCSKFPNRHMYLCFYVSLPNLRKYETIWRKFYIYIYSMQRISIIISVNCIILSSQIQLFSKTYEGRLSSCDNLLFCIYLFNKGFN